MRSSVSIRLFLALTYAAALCAALWRSERGPARLHAGPTCDAPCTPVAPPPDDPRWRRLLGLAPCWWTVSRDDLTVRVRLSDAAATRVLAARDAGVAPFVDPLVRRGVRPRDARRVATSVALACRPAVSAHAPH